jgi:hypothetical protein
MGLFIVQSSWQGFRINSLAPHAILPVRPVEGYPRGREALELSNVWMKIRDSGRGGVLLLGCDVAADPDDYYAMATSVHQWPEDVHTGMVKLWPAATKRADWMWSHRDGPLGNPVASQIEPIHPTYFSLGFVFIPHRLMDLAFPAHDDWKWGEMDVGLSEIGIMNHIRVHAVMNCTPKHLHFRPEHNL